MPPPICSRVCNPDPVVLAVKPRVLRRAEFDPYWPVFNFPHQINDLTKLRAALVTFRELQLRGLDLNDDKIVGTEMARNEVYAFRNKTRTLSANLESEAAKPRSSRGTETFARDLRRFFLLLGFLRPELNGDLSITSMGDYVLALRGDSAGARGAWRTALRNVALTNENGGVSHPYLILLRLVSARPGLQAARLALALEARDDSDEEFARIVALANAENWADVRASLDVSESHAANATKILPGLARQLGELRLEGNRYYVVSAAAIARHDPSESVPRAGTPTSTRAVSETDRTPLGFEPASRSEPPERDAGALPRRGSRQVTSTTIAPPPSGSVRHRLEDEIEYADPAFTAELRRDRLGRHQLLVRALAGAFEAAGYDLLEDPFDLLAAASDRTSVLVEAKTLDGSAADEVAQVRAALAQLLYYEVFSVSADRQTRGLLLVALFEHRISEAHVAFLESRGLCIAWWDSENRRLVAPQRSAELLTETNLPTNVTDL